MFKVNVPCQVYDPQLVARMSEKPGNKIVLYQKPCISKTRVNMKNEYENGGMLAFWCAKLQDGLSWWQRCLPPCTDRHLCSGEQWTWNSKAIKGCLMIVCGLWLLMIKVVNLSLLNLAIAAGRQEKRPKMKLVEITICKTKGRVKILLREV